MERDGVERDGVERDGVGHGHSKPHIDIHVAMKVAETFTAIVNLVWLAVPNVWLVVRNLVWSVVGVVSCA